MRAFSHGCIRLEKPEELAQWVLGLGPPASRRGDEQGEDNQRVKLPKKIPVYIVYLTAYKREGQLYFGNDLYSRDEKLQDAVGAVGAE